MENTKKVSIFKKGTVLTPFKISKSEIDVLLAKSKEEQKSILKRKYVNPESLNALVSL